MSKQANIEEIYPLSPLQAGLLFHTQFETGSGVYVEQLSCELHGELQADAFSRSWRLLAERHSILRTAFVWQGQREPVQVVHKSLEIPCVQEDWRHLTSEEQTTRLEKWLDEDRRAGFALNRAPLLRLATIRMADDVWQLVSSHHHIILDGWSFPLLLQEFGESYRAFCAGSTPRFSPAIPFSRYISWLKSRNSWDAERFWRKELEGFTSPTSLALPRGQAPGKEYQDASIVLSPEQTEQLQTAARTAGVTLNTLVQGAYATVLSRYNSSNDVVFGVTVAGRPADLRGVERIVGLFINTLPLRVSVPSNASVASWLSGLQDRQLALDEFSYAGLTDIQGWSDVPRGQPLFESLLVFENYPIDESLPNRLGGLIPKRISFVERSNYPLTIIALPGAQLTLRASFDAQQLDRAAVSRMLGHISHALLALTTLDARVGEIEIVGQQEREEILRRANERRAVSPANTTLHQSFSAQAQATPEAIAITHGDLQITYRELDSRSNAVAGALAAMGMQPGDRVGLLLDRSVGLIVAILGILKSGAAYVPMDPVYPDDRLAWMITDSALRVVLTDSSFANRVPSAAVMRLDELPHKGVAPSVAAGPSHPAYVIYTSGSTGRSKGCVITHANVTRLFDSTRHWFSFGPSDVWTLFHSVAFDFSVWEIWGALLYGGRLVIVPYYQSREPEAFLELVLREQVTVLNQTPSAFRQFMVAEESRLTASRLALRYVIFGGESLNLGSLRTWFARHGDQRPQLVNMYGITETTVHVTYRALTATDAQESRGSLIGEAIPDLAMVVLDHNGHLAPIGIAGELHIAGAGLSPGYLSRPALTAERFSPDPFQLDRTGGRLYRTGDLARQLPDGDCEYLGRIDHQVKIRGFRIELGEIESELSAHAQVHDAVVELRNERLIAYVVSEGERPQADKLRARLLQRLPAYMVPAVFLFLDRLPLTANGKLDRRALPSPDSEAPAPMLEPVEPRNEPEAKLVAIWRDVLGVAHVGIRDNYFALGGDSIRSLAIRSRAKQAGIDFTLQDLFEKQTIEALLVDTCTPAPAGPAPEHSFTRPFSLVPGLDPATLPSDVEDAYPLTSLQLGMLFHSHETEGSSSYLDTFSFHLGGPLDEAALQASLEAIIQEHAVLRTSFDVAAQPEPLQRVHRSPPAPIAWTDLSQLPAAAQALAVDSFARQEATKPFDWTTTPLFRVHVHRRTDSFQFTISVHHAILDGWSVASLLTELFHDYLHRTARAPGRARRTPRASFRDFVKLERDAISSSESKEFWHKTLHGASFLTLPKPSPRASASIHNRYKTVSVSIHDSLSNGLTHLAERLGLPLKSVLLAAHIRVLSLVGNQRDVVTGLVSNGRPEELDAEHLAGLFLNVLPFRFYLPDSDWTTVIKAVFAAETAAMPHRRVPLVELQRRTGSEPLLNTDFNFVNFHVFDSLRGVDSLQLLDSKSREETNFALAANFSRDSVTGSVSGSLSVDLESLDPVVTASLPDLYLKTLRAIVEAPEQDWRKAQISPVAPLEGTPLQTGAPRLLHSLVEAQVDQTPHAVAVIDERATLTYAELDTRANRLAHWLHQQQTGPEQRVGIAISRSVDLVVALLGVLKSGAAWVPLDPSHPRDRLDMLTRNMQAILTLSDATLTANAAAIAEQPATRPNVTVWPECAAYVLYTSGSTGAPKGVIITHDAIVNHMLWMQRDFPLHATDVVLQKTPITFDASVWEFWAPLLAGATLAMAKPEGHQDPEYLATAVESWGITTLQLVPSMLDFVLEPLANGKGRSLRRIFSGGEPLRPETRDRVFQLLDAQLINLYGPTEATIDALVHICERDGEVPIGRPVANMQAWVLDRHLSPVPAGVDGELYLAGAGLGRGYFGSPALTAERFIPNPFSAIPGQRMYRSGDVVRLCEDGVLLFVGRADFQLKIRGHRVEPGEIESALESMPDVARAVVVPRQKDGRVSLIAYVVPHNNDSWSAAQATEYLKQRLPAHMIPASMVMLDRIPLTPNGKVDRRNLPAPDTTSPAPNDPREQPGTPVEEQLCEMWKRILGVPNLGIHDNFFELGGDSIQSLRLVSMAAQAGWKIRPKQVFDHPTIAALARVLELRSAQAPPTETDIDTGNIPLLPVQSDFFALQAPNPSHWNQAVLLKTRAGFSAAMAESAWRRVIERHDAFRLRFQWETADWRQWLADSAECPFVCAPLADIDRYVEQAHTSLNVQRGPLAASVYCEGPAGEPGRWLIVAHHLITDGVSWRVWLEELALACQSLDVTVHEETSFAAWAVRLRREAAKPETLAEAPFWIAVAEGSGNCLPVETPEQPTRNTERSVQSIQTCFDDAATGRLLRELPVLYRCRVEDLLLSALSAALENWTGGSVLVDLEGHGREQSLGGGELSQTIGWFTTIFPVRLPAAGDDSWGRLRAIKETLRSVPRNGIGYGLLRDFAPDPTLRARLTAGQRAAVSFNYLGQLDQVLASGGPFEVAPEGSGMARSADTPRRYLIDVVAKIAGGRLQVEWLYSEAMHSAAQVEAAAAAFHKELSTLLTRQSAATAVIPSDFPFAKLDPAALAKIVETRDDIQDIWPVTPLQEGMLLHAVHGDEPGSYVQQITMELHGAIHHDALRTAWQELARRYEVLRSEFRWQDLNQPCQIVRRDVPLAITIFDWSTQPRDAMESSFEQWINADRSAGFDLTQGPLWRVALFQFAGAQNRLVWTHHHLLLDGWSLPLVFEQLTAAYAAAAQCTTARRHDSGFCYADYLRWLNETQSIAQEDFWKGWLHGFRRSAQLELGTPPKTSTYARTTTEWQLSPAATQQLRGMAEGLQVTLGTCLQAVWGLLLARWSKQADVVFGVVVAGRPVEVPAIESAVGMFINTLPMRVRVNPEQSVAQWIRSLHKDVATLRQFEHSRLVDVLRWSGFPQADQLFEALLIIENYPINQGESQSVAGITFGKVEAMEQTSLPLNLYAVPGEQLTLRLEYAQSRFTAESMNLLADSLTGLLTTFPSRLDEPLGRVGVLPAALYPAIDAQSNHNRDLWDATPVIKRIAAQARRHPSSIAIDWMERSVTYRELDDRSHQLAHFLRSSGVRENSIVGVYLDRSPDLLITLLGIWKARAAYVPMDPAFPAERLQMMVADSQLTHLVTDTTGNSHHLLLPPSIVQIHIDADAAAIAAHSVDPSSHAPDNNALAYVIFTSGSSGRPKGVQVTQRALANFLSHFAESPGLRTTDVLLAITTLSFDIAALELFLPLTVGAKVVIAPRDAVADASALAAMLAETKATVMQATPATWRLLLETDWRPAPGFQAWCGGEALPPDLAQSLLDRGVLLWNLYGPTETTIWSTAHQVTDRTEASCIGRPIANTQCWVLDDCLNPVAPGMVGDLYLGGEGLARGYIGRPALTAERFIPNPFRAGTRLYATGDSVRWDSNRLLRFLGRTDQQVKIRGFRIELEEIEAALRALPGIRNAAVTTRRDASGSFQLLAFAQGLADAGGPAEVRAGLRARLPEYMVPSTFHEIAALPMTPNGKVDRRNLPTDLLPEATALPPHNAVEQVLVDLWKELLEKQQVGIDTNFFEHGGHSLLAAQVLSRMQKYFQVQLPLRTFFQTATPEAVAASLLAADSPAGRIPKIATAILRLRAMSPEEREQLKNRKTSAGQQ